MPWTDRLTRAKWRDFEFLTEDHEARSGRRMVVHEYPGSDISLVEDFGLKSWDWSLTAYFVGPDYDQKRNEFLTLLSDPAPDWLTHPWLGLLWARAHEWTLTESNEQGGYCTVKVSWVAGGETLQPTLNYGDVAEATCRESAAAAVEDFELQPMSADALRQYIATVSQRLEGLRKIISLATLPLAWASTTIRLIEGLKGDLKEIAGIPKSYANALLGVVHALGLSTGKGKSIAADLKPSSRSLVVGRIGSAAGDSRRAVTLTGAPASDTTLLANLRAEYALEQRLIAAAALDVAIAEYQTEADRDSALAAVNRVVDTLAYVAHDPVFHATEIARAAVIRALLNQDIKPSVTRNIARPLPAALVAHNLGMDETTLIERNAIRHPLFVNGEVHG